MVYVEIKKCMVYVEFKIMYGVSGDWNNVLCMWDWNNELCI